MNSVLVMSIVAISVFLVLEGAVAAWNAVRRRQRATTVLPAYDRGFRYDVFVSHRTSDDASRLVAAMRCRGLSVFLHEDCDLWECCGTLEPPSRTAAMLYGLRASRTVLHFRDSDSGWSPWVEAEQQWAREVEERAGVPVLLQFGALDASAGGAGEGIGWAGLGDLVEMLRARNQAVVPTGPSRRHCAPGVEELSVVASYADDVGGERGRLLAGR